MKTKLVKPKNLDLILAISLILKSRQAYLRLIKYSSPPVNLYTKEMKNIVLRTTCAARNRKDITEGAYRYDLCNNVQTCDQCFLNANNCLNILKYLKHRNDGKAKETKENQ